MDTGTVTDAGIENIVYTVVFTGEQIQPIETVPPSQPPEEVKPTAYSDGLVNLVLAWFHRGPIDFIDGPYWAKMFVLCFYTIWVVMPFKILILTSALEIGRAHV